MKSFAVPSSRVLTVLRGGLHAAAWLPLVWLVVCGLGGWLGDEPVRVTLWTSGDWSLYFLCLTLAVTPLRRLTGWDWLARFRRLPGMYAFAYGVLHFGAYLWLRRTADWFDVFARMVTRPALLTGFVALVIMLVLAATSVQAAFRWLGVTGWQWLHRLTYIVAVLAVLHFWLEVARYGSSKPLWFGGIVAFLLLFRVVSRWCRRPLRNRLG